MKRIDRSFDERLPAVSLYLDDIEVILDELRQWGSEVSLSDQEYKFASLDEFVKVRGTCPSCLKIGVVTERHLDSVDLEIHRWGALGLWLRASRAGEHVAYRIRELLNRRRRWWTYVLVTRFWLSVMLLTAVAMVTQGFPPLRIGSHQAILLPILFAAAGLLTVLSFLVSFGYGSRINLAHKHAGTTIWSRNREKLILIVISALLGAVATEFVHRLMGGRR